MAAGGCHLHQGSPSGNGCSGRQSNHGADKRGSLQRYTYNVDARGLPLRVTVASDAVADCTEFRNLIEKVEKKSAQIIADTGYDSDELINYVRERGAKPVILPRSNRKSPRECDKHLYQVRHLVENAF